MPNIIRNAQVVADSWSPVNGTGDSLAQPLPGGDLLLPLALWQAQREALLAHARQAGVRFGLRVDGDTDPAVFAADLGYFELIAIRFPSFGDGRGYSLARLLRERHGFKGELRAIGDVIRDNLSYLARCGFDAFELNAGSDPEASLASLNDFSEAYQATVTEPQPLFRRRRTGVVA
jgi:uncharacterized protein (DUF934 family)